MTLTACTSTNCADIYGIEFNNEIPQFTVIIDAA